MKKGISAFISFVILTLIAITTITLVIFIGKPSVDRATETANINEAIQNMKILDNIIKEVASEGTGSHRAVVFQISDGEYKMVNASGNFTGVVKFTKDLTYSPYTPMTFIKDGDLKVSVGFDSVGLVGYWKFDEYTGATAADSSMFENNGTLTSMNTTGNATSGWTGDGKFRSALRFDGVNDYVNLGNSSSLTTLSARTVSFWWKSTQTSGNKGIITFIGGYNRGFAFIGTSPLLILNNSNYRYWADMSSYFDGNWHHIVVTLPNTTTTGITGATLTVDGLSINAGATLSTDNVVAWTTHYIGTSSYGYFNGTIDEVQIYNRALSSDEVKENYNAKVSNYQVALEYKKIKIMGSERFGKGTQKICIEKMGVENSKAVVAVRRC